ncbi:agmatinase [Thermus thermophilus]|uniref:agmatinase n=1 Tax=Thermus thermophilus TaxID=274 RepID=UPI001FCC0733|nr:agmatinase [Thermus thermophilus]
MRAGELTFTGPHTFFKAPYLPLEATWEADVALLGLPYDFAVGFRPGARFAPSAIREASARYAFHPEEGLFDPERGPRLRGVRVVDAGDVDPAQLEYQESFRRITEAARALRARVRLPVFVGGDHSVTLPVLRAYAGEPLYVVQLDAHLDFSDQRHGTRYSNSSPFRRAVEELPGLQGITCIGLRGLRVSPEAYWAAKERGHVLVSAHEVRQNVEAVKPLLPQDQRVYVSLDVDVLDPALLPGTSSPEVEGLSYGETLALLEGVIERNELVGVDLVELAPNLDPTGLSSLVAARLLAEVLALWWAKASG